jgi:hypothetical protein
MGRRGGRGRTHRKDAGEEGDGVGLCAAAEPWGQVLGTGRAVRTERTAAQWCLTSAASARSQSAELAPVLVELVLPGASSATRPVVARLVKCAESIPHESVCLGVHLPRHPADADALELSAETARDFVCSSVRCACLTAETPFTRSSTSSESMKTRIRWIP